MPLAFVLVGCKLHKVAVLGRGLGWYSLVAVSSDVVLLAALGLGSLLLLHAARGAWRWLALAGVGLVLGGATVLAVAEHGFFVTTGALFDGRLLRHGLTHFEELRPVLLASTPTWAWVAMGLAACLIMAPIGVGVLPVVRARLGQSASSGPSRIRRIVAGVSLLLLSTSLLALGGRLPGPLEPLRPPAVANVFQGLFGAGALVTPRVEPVEPLRLAVADGAPRHNVVIVVLESTRAQSTTPYAPTLDTTPNLARLAARGALVREAYTTIPHTTKSLVPLLCGIPPKVVVANDEALPDAMPVECLPALLGERGWATALFQSVDEAYERGDLLARSFGFSTYKGPESLLTEGFDRCSYFGYEDDVLVEPALGWAERQGGPFLLTLATVVPHHEYTVPAGFARRRWGTGNAELDRYLDTVRYVDRFLGKVVEGLERRGLADDTIFVVIGDHGEGFGEHGRYQHDAVLYEEGLRVPLVLAGPGVEPGTVVEGLRQNVDVVPTVLELLGMRVEAGPLTGRSLLSSPGHEALYFACHYEAYCLGMRRGGRTYIHHFDRRPMEVYDVATDPGQTVDLAAEVSEGELSEARAAMLDWQARSLGLYEAQRQRLLERFVTRGAGPVDTAADVRFGDAVRLRGWSVEPRVIEPGDSVQVIVDFEVLAQAGPGWALFMHLVGGDRHINLDHEPVAGAWPVSAWRPGDFVRDRSWVRIPADLPPGVYEVVFGLWDKEGDGERIPPRGAGSDDEGRVHIGPIHVLARR
ncbi:MAG: hypothetical protein AMXMBFR64_35710 [Myxococcales bacterium]